MIESGRAPATGVPDAEASARIASLEREARAVGNGLDAARLWHEIGRSWEDLQSPRNAAIAYQNAYRLAPGLLPNLRSARRLFADVGNWQMVAQLADAEAQVAQTDSERARLLVEKGLVLQERLGRQDEAVACFEKALTLQPGDLLALHQLEGAHADGKDPRALASVHDRLAAAVEDQGLKVLHLSSAASLRERAGQKEEALRQWREAFALDRHDPVVLSALERLTEAAGRWEELLSVLAAAAESAGPSAASMLCRAARIQREQLGREDLALATLGEARRLAPHDVTVLDELAQLLEARSARAELCDVLEARAAGTRDPAERASILVRLGGLYDEGEDRPRAVQRYLAALELAPGNSHVLSALGRLQYQLEDYEGLLATFEAEAASAGELRLKAARLFKAGELLEERLGRQTEAIVRYEAILAFAPGYLPAQKALTRLYEKLGRHPDLVAMLERELASAADTEQSLDLLGRIADIQERLLGDGSAAMATFERMLQVAPDHLPTIRALARAAERRGDHEALVRANDREAALTSDQRQVVALLHRNCEILEEHLGDRDRAIEAYRKVLALAPSYLPALRSLGRLLAQKGRWEELADMYRQEAEVAPTADAAAGLHVKIGELRETRIIDEERAVASYREALALSPGHLGALARLEHLFAARGAWDELVQVLREDASARLDEGERARVLLQIAQLQEERLGRADEAADTYQEALRHDPHSLPALRALDRLYARSNAFRELAQVWERELLATPPADRVPVLSRLTWIYLEKLSDRAKASQMAQSVLGLDAANLRALKTLERIRTADGDRIGRADLRARTAAAVHDPREAAALLAGAASDRDRGPGDVGLSELQRAVALTPGDARTRQELESALRRAGDRQGLATLAESDAASATDPELRLSALLRLGELRESLGDDAGSLAAFRDALLLAPGILPALQGTRRIHLRAGDFASVRAALRQEGAATKDVDRAVECFLEAGTLAEERLADVSAAAQDYRSALERRPLEPRAEKRLETVLALSGGPQQLAELYEQRGRAERTASAAADALVAAARIWTETLEQPQRAAALLSEALRRMPAHPEALERRGDLAFASAQWEAAAMAYAARVQLGGDPRQLATLHLRLGQIHADRDPARAAAHLQASLSAVPDLLDALTLLAQLHLRARNLTGATDALRRVLELEAEPTRRARAHVDLARALEEQGDLAAAADQYQKAIDIDPQNAMAVDLLASVSERMGDSGRLVRALEMRAGLSSDPALASQLRLRAAELWAGPLRDAEHAVVAYRAVLEHRPNDVSARAALAALYARTPGTYGAAVDEHRALLRLDPLRVESYRALYQLWEAQGAHDRAFTAAALLVAMRAADAAEAAYHAQLSANRPVDPGGVLSAEDVESLAHPLEKTQLARLFRALGDQLTKILPPDLDRYGVARGDKLRDASALRRIFDRLLGSLGASAEVCDVYLARSDREAVAVENADPFAIIVGPDVTARWSRREQGFLFGRLVWRVIRHTAPLLRIDTATLATLVGAAVRVVDPSFEAVGSRDRDLDRRLFRALSRKGKKALEGPAAEVAVLSGFDLSAVIAGARYAADRAGLLLCGDAGVALSLVLREDGGRYDSPAAIAHALRVRPELSELVHFALGEEHFRLRAVLKMSVV